MTRLWSGTSSISFLGMSELISGRTYYLHIYINHITTYIDDSKDILKGHIG